MIPIVNCNGDNVENSESKSSIDSEKFSQEQKDIETKFSNFNKDQQIYLVQGLLKQMSHYQHGQVDSYLKPMLQRDFITDLPAKGLFHVSEQILSYLDSKSLCAASQVSHSWRQVIREGMLWKKLIERNVITNSLWRGLGERRGWICKLRVPGGEYNFGIGKQRLGSGGSKDNSLLSGIDSHRNKNDGLSSPINTNDFYGGMSDLMNDNSTITGYELMDAEFYRKLYPEIISNIKRINQNWLNGKCNVKKIECHSEASKGVYCLQYDDKKIVSGLRDNTIKVWDARTLECIRILTGHVGSVLCLQYDENVIISGSSDSTVRVWSLHNWACVNTIYHHCEAVLHLRFAHSILVTCSKDRSIAVWDMFAASDIRLRRVLVGHRAAVNVVDFDQKNIVSASGDRTIKVWNTQTCEFIHTMTGHKRGIACLQYRNNLVVSGSSDNSIRLWQIESGNCLRILEGHEELVRCIRFDEKYIVSGAYDGKIKVWDLEAALNPQTPTPSLCLQTLNEHTGRVFRLQFDEFQIVSSSHDDTILIWDFLDTDDSNDLDKTLEMITTPRNIVATNLVESDSISTEINPINTNPNHCIVSTSANNVMLGSTSVRSPVISLESDENYGCNTTNNNNDYEAMVTVPPSNTNDGNDQIISLDNSTNNINTTSNYSMVMMMSNYSTPNNNSLNSDQVIDGSNSSNANISLVGPVPMVTHNQIHNSDDIDDDHNEEDDDDDVGNSIINDASNHNDDEDDGGDDDDDTISITTNDVFAETNPHHHRLHHRTHLNNNKSNDNNNNSSSSSSNNNNVHNYLINIPLMSSPSSPSYMLGNQTQYNMNNSNNSNTSSSTSNNKKTNNNKYHKHNLR